MQEPQAQSQTTCKRCLGQELHEYYTYYWGAYEYDVDKAWAIVRDGREAVEVEEESVRASVDDSRVDKEHVPHVDPSIPGLIAHIHYTDDDGTTYKGHVLIDGHHRAARCLEEKIPFHAFLLTEEESQTVMTRYAQFDDSDASVK